MKKLDAVYNGGGIKIISSVGATCCVEDKGYSFNRVAGTSAGAILSSLIATGHTGKEIKDIMMNLDFTKFIAKDKIQSIPLIGKYIGLIKEKGMYSTTYIEEWINELLQKKGKTKFKDVYENGEFKLKIITADLNTQTLVILPDILRDYNIDPFEFPIAKAVAMSVSIPGFYKPYTLEYKDKDKVNKIAYFVDGAVCSNFAVWIFDCQGRPPQFPTFGFHLGMEDTYNYITSKTPIKNYISCILETMIDKNEEVYMRDKDIVRCISLPTNGVQTTDFSLSQEKALELYNAGYQATTDFLKTWNFNEYVRKHRTKH